ncbi:hypothetical protein [Bosea sp. (in: a-proteobacteria)]|uniref:hypothetical protein n=1 Tax=Bosea sp. (in: a-proteobacteria) TaxID=1871050 RepID=UPI0027346393|nr:hypothetical protein [Bosea sp. (in: a-proteobacteria)]MDP3408107.1 hypothetical protein [Bosea sp. (in: a-proteobacteria)]
MNDQAMIGFAMGLAHEAGRKREDLTESRVADIISEAQRMSDFKNLPQLPSTITVGRLNVSVAALQNAFRNDPIVRMTIDAVSRNQAYNLKPTEIRPEEADTVRKALTRLAERGEMTDIEDLAAAAEIHASEALLLCRRLAVRGDVEFDFAGERVEITGSGRQWLKESTTPPESPGHDMEECNVILALRRMGPCQVTAISEGTGWPPRRVRTVMQRLCVKGLVAPYMGSLYKITNAGNDFIIETSDA